MSGLIQRRIVGIGEALLAEHGADTMPSGLAVDVAIWATRCGHIGIPISRLGQDDRGRRIAEALRELEIDVTHLQSDPDLPTARRVVRMIGGRDDAGSARLDERAAFDNLQWDFDLTDVAREADAVIFGMTAQRGGLSGSVIRRFLSEATGALRVFDLTNRAGDDFDHSQAQRSMESADIVIVDRAAASMLLHRSDPPDLSSRSVIKQLLGLGRAVMAVTVADGDPPVLHAGEASLSVQAAWHNSLHAAMRMALVHSQLRGDDFSATVAVIDRLMRHAHEQPDAPVSYSLLE